MEVTNKGKDGKMKKYLTVHNLYETIDNGDGTMDLRFEIEDKTVWVKGVKVPDNVSEFYFDVDEIVQNAIETGWIEY
jgi:Cu/Ag efflux protein CusF